MHMSTFKILIVYNVKCPSRFGKISFTRFICFLVVLFFYPPCFLFSIYLFYFIPRLHLSVSSQPIFLFLSEVIYVKRASRNAKNSMSMDRHICWQWLTDNQQEFAHTYLNSYLSFFSMCICVCVCCDLNNLDAETAKHLCNLTNYEHEEMNRNVRKASCTDQRQAAFDKVCQV